MDLKALAVILIWAVVMATGATLSEPDVTKDCDTLGQFRHGDVVYVCHRKPAAEGTVK